MCLQHCYLYNLVLALMSWILSEKQGPPNQDPSIKLQTERIKKDSNLTCFASRISSLFFSSASFCETFSNDSRSLSCTKNQRKPIRAWNKTPQRTQQEMWKKWEGGQYRQDICVVFLLCPLVKKHADLSGSFLYSLSTMKDMYSKPTNRT